MKKFFKYHRYIRVVILRSGWESIKKYNKFSCSTLLIVHSRGGDNTLGITTLYVLVRSLVYYPEQSVQWQKG